MQGKHGASVLPAGRTLLPTAGRARPKRAKGPPPDQIWPMAGCRGVTPSWTSPPTCGASIAAHAARTPPT